MYKDRHLKIERECEWCGNRFMAQQSRIKLGQGRFCSLKCANDFQREEGQKTWGYENGRKYWDGERWIVRWYDEDGGHTTSYQKWWWETTNNLKIPDGLYVVLKDGDPENISPNNFVIMDSEEFGVIRGQKNIGNKFSEESKKKMSASKKGKPLTKEHRENIGKSVKMRWERGDFLNTIFVDISGDKNPGWRGGAGQEYPPEFSKVLKKIIWERDNSLCQICGTHVSKKGAIGHIHHIDGYKDNNDQDNLILLCLHCHGKIHKSNDMSSPVIMAFRSKLYWNQ